MKETEWRSRLVKEFNSIAPGSPRFIWAMDAKFKAGFPDIYLIHTGISMHYELKVRKTISSEPSIFSAFEKIQISVMNSINRAGGYARGLVLVEDTSSIYLVNHHKNTLRKFVTLAEFYYWWTGSQL